MAKRNRTTKAAIGELRGVRAQIKKLEARQARLVAVVERERDKLQRQLATCEKRASKKRASKKRASKKRASKKRASKKRASKKRASKKRASKAKPVTSKPTRDRWLALVEQLQRPATGLTSIADWVRASGVSTRVAHNQLTRMWRAGSIELRPEGGFARLDKADLALSMPGPQATRLAWIRLR